MNQWPTVAVALLGVVGVIVGQSITARNTRKTEAMRIAAAAAERAEGRSHDLLASRVDEASRRFVDHLTLAIKFAKLGNEVRVSPGVKPSGIDRLEDAYQISLHEILIFHPNVRPEALALEGRLMSGIRKNAISVPDPTASLTDRNLTDRAISRLRDAMTISLAKLRGQAHDQLELSEVPVSGETESINP